MKGFSNVFGWFWKVVSRFLKKDLEVGLRFLKGFERFLKGFEMFLFGKRLFRNVFEMF